MEKDDSLLLLSSDSTSLCFSKEEFAKETFSVDSFVSEHRKHASLEKLREDLGVYLRILHSSMVELINHDYADFVNLSTNLAGLDKSINSLCVPLGQLREEIMSVKLSLEEALTSVEFYVSHQRETRQKKITLQRVREIITGVEKLQKLVEESPISSPTFQNKRCQSLPGSVVERIATELNQVQFHLDRVLPGISLIENVRPSIRKIWILVEQYLEKSFLENLSKDETGNLHTVLRICLITDSSKKIQSLFLKQVVRPYMMEVIAESVLQQEGIEGVLSRTLDFLPTRCKRLLQMTDGEGDYEFVTEVIWPEVVSCLESRTPLIFSPGNPNHFHQNYLASMRFLQQFESKCSLETAQKLKRSPAYHSFLEKWNLPVYFQIRFREIAGDLEKALSTPFHLAPEGSEFRLESTATLWKCLNRCWSEGVILLPLIHRFWKLTLQLLARFRTWVETTTTTQSNRSSREESPAEGVENNRLVMNGPDSGVTLDHHHPNVVQIVQLVIDVQLLCNKVPLFFKEVVQPIQSSEGFQNFEVVEGGLQEALTVMASLPDRLGELVVADLVSQCGKHIKLATDIPRLYRKTNREVPSKPSPYVSTILQPVEMFRSSQGALLPANMWDDWSQKVVHHIADQYLGVTRDVLTSVRKMEDSLKRLKKARERTPTGTSGSSANPGTVGDDDKIRLQFGLDVQSFGKTIESLGISSKGISSYQQLVEFVEASRNSPSSIS